MAHGENNLWNEERIARAKKLWLEGRSAAFIAADLNCGFSRNAVAGKLDRLGMSRNGPSAPKHAGGRPRKDAPPKPAPPPRPTAPSRPKELPSTMAAPEEPIRVPVLVQAPAPDRQRILALPGTCAREEVGDARRCRWPVGDPAASGFSYCGRPTAQKENGRPDPYCVEHGKVAYQPPADKKKAARNIDYLASRYN